MTSKDEGLAVRPNEEVERTTPRRAFAPATDIVENAEEYRLTAELPGADPESVDVSFEDRILTIRATAPPREHAGYRPALSEFEFGDYERAFEITENVDAEAIEADFKNGVLTLRLPKAKPARKKVTVATS